MMKPLILIADDDPDILAILRVGLQAKGYDTVAAADGREALVALNQTNPDLALLDIEMPHLSGIEVLKHIRQERPG